MVNRDGGAKPIRGSMFCITWLSAYISWHQVSRETQTNTHPTHTAYTRTPPPLPSPLPEICSSIVRYQFSCPFTSFCVYLNRPAVQKTILFYSFFALSHWRRSSLKYFLSLWFFLCTSFFLKHSNLLFGDETYTHSHTVLLFSPNLLFTDFFLWYSHCYQCNTEPGH